MPVTNFPAYTGTALSRNLTQVQFDEAEEYFQAYQAAWAAQMNDTTIPQLNALETACANSASTAATKAAEALNSANNASGSAVLANKWAEEAEDVEVTAGHYSALHWATKAYQYVATLATGAINDSIIALNATWSSSKISGIFEAVDAGISASTTRQDIHIPLSGFASYHLLSGSLQLQNTVITAGMATTRYTGNGTTQSVVTGVDMATQWGDSASETFGGLVWGKSRSNIIDNIFIDTVRTKGYYISSNTTSAQINSTTMITSFNSDGFTLGAHAGLNTSAATYASWVFQTTHRKSGVTNHGKAYTCHYNPFTGFTIVKYEGSGLAGHEIPHHLGRKLGLMHCKLLTADGSWISSALDTYKMRINTTDAGDASATTVLLKSNDTSMITPSVSDLSYNASSNTYVLYGWANSYFDEANTLIGNYEIGVYQGTGAAGNKVTTKGKPAWVMIKRLDSASDWIILDNQRGSFDGNLFPNLSNAEATVDNIDIASDGFIHKSSGTGNNASGGQYLYMVVYDNDNGSGKSKYPRATDSSTLNLNATIPFANGVDANGAKTSILVKNETVSGLTFTQGKNYVYSKNDGTYGVMSVAPTYSNVNPANGGDFYNVLENKWYTSAGVAITESRNYLDAIVYADANGQPTYVEQMPKTHYFDEVKANEFKGKNAITCKGTVDITTTPPTVSGGYNIKTAIRTATGICDVYFETPMDNLNFDVINGGDWIAGAFSTEYNKSIRALNKVTIACSVTAGTLMNGRFSFVITGGKN